MRVSTGAQPDSPAWVLEGSLSGLAEEAGSLRSHLESGWKLGQDSPISEPHPHHSAHTLFPLLLWSWHCLLCCHPRGREEGVLSPPPKGPGICPSAVRRLLLYNNTLTSPNCSPTSLCLSGRKCWAQGRVLSGPCDGKDGRHPDSSRALTSPLCWLAASSSDRGPLLAVSCVLDHSKRAPHSLEPPGCCPDGPRLSLSGWGVMCSHRSGAWRPSVPRMSHLHSTGLVALTLLSRARVQQSLTEAFFPDTH